MMGDGKKSGRNGSLGDGVRDGPKVRDVPGGGCTWALLIVHLWIIGTGNGELPV
jgi:hypothetical protein